MSKEEKNTIERHHDAISSAHQNDHLPRMSLVQFTECSEAIAKTNTSVAIRIDVVKPLGAGPGPLFFSL